jgi:hypothetical protein
MSSLHVTHVHYFEIIKNASQIKMKAQLGGLFGLPQL